MCKIPLEKPPGRVVSLVPSMTESLVQLGFGDSLVGITDYCDYPDLLNKRIMRVGGPKTPDIEAIRALKPNLVLINREENSQEVAQKLQDFGIYVWVTFPKTVQEVIHDSWNLVNLFRHENAIFRLKTLEKAVELAEQALIDKTPTRYFCAIWKEINQKGESIWMTFNADTYPNDILRLCGGENVFGGLGYHKQNHNKNDAFENIRFPKVSLDEVLRLEPEVILLPDEPYKFSTRDALELKELIACLTVKEPRICLLDGRMITWHGVHMGIALRELPEYLGK